MTDLNPALVHAAQRAGMHDPDDLRILAPAQLHHDPAAVIADLKAQRPHLFAKLAKDMTQQERNDAIRAASRAASTDPAPLPTPSARAKDMSVEAQAEYLRAYARKFPDQSRSLSIPRKSPYKV